MKRGLFLVALAGCYSPRINTDAKPIDAAVVDGQGSTDGVVDAAATDAMGTSDSRFDTMLPDAGPPDARLIDAAASCSGQPDGTACVGGICHGGSCDSTQCYISFAWWPEDQRNPSNICQYCNPSQSQTTWSAEADGTACSGGLCRAGTCDPGVCWIDGRLWSDGQDNPADNCQTCSPMLDRTAWTLRGDGTVCYVFPRSGQCYQGSCCTGCWSGTACEAGTSVVYCGSSGLPCTRCYGVCGCDATACPSQHDTFDPPSCTGGSCGLTGGAVQCCGLADLECTGTLACSPGLGCQ